MRINFEIKDVGEYVEFTTSGDDIDALEGEKATPAQLAALKVRNLINLMVELLNKIESEKG